MDLELSLIFGVFVGLVAACIILERRIKALTNEVEDIKRRLR
ncbi:MAG: hypothetical protein AAF205_00260 [Pseudomonadota bacterium]